MAPRQLLITIKVQSIIVSVSLQDLLLTGKHKIHATVQGSSAHVIASLPDNVASESDTEKTVLNINT